MPTSSGLWTVDCSDEGYTCLANHQDDLVQGPQRFIEKRFQPAFSVRNSLHLAQIAPGPKYPAGAGQNDRSRASFQSFANGGLQFLSHLNCERIQTFGSV